MKRHLESSGFFLILSVAFALFHGPFALAELDTTQNGTLPLSTAIEEGLGKSPTVQKARASADKTEWGKTEALSGLLPKISVSAAHFVNLKFQKATFNFQGNPTTFPFISPYSTLAFNFSLPVFDGLQNVNRYSAAKLESEAAENEAKWTEFQAALNIRLTFFQAIAAHKLLGVAHQNVKTLDDHLNQVKALRGGGIATNFDVLRVEVLLNEAKSDELSAEDSLVLTRRKLAETMGMDQDDRGLIGELPVPDTKKVQSLSSEKHFSGRADIVALQKKTEAAEKLHSAAKVYLVPRISVGGEYLIYNNVNASITNSAAYQNAYAYGVFLTWNLFDGAVSIARSKQSYYQQIETEKGLEEKRIKVPNDFDFWKRRYLYSSTLYQARLSDVQKAQESVRLAHAGFKAGTRTSSEILDSELDLFRSRAGVVNAQMNANEALINLELSMGRLL